MQTKRKIARVSQVITDTRPAELMIYERTVEVWRGRPTENRSESWWFPVKQTRAATFRGMRPLAKGDVTRCPVSRDKKPWVERHSPRASFRGALRQRVSGGRSQGVRMRHSWQSRRRTRVWQRLRGALENSSDDIPRQPTWLQCDVYSRIRTRVRTALRHRVRGRSRDRAIVLL